MNINNKTDNVEIEKLEDENQRKVFQYTVLYAVLGDTNVDLSVVIEKSLSHLNRFDRAVMISDMMNELRFSFSEGNKEFIKCMHSILLKCRDIHHEIECQVSDEEGPYKHSVPSRVKNMIKSLGCGINDTFISGAYFGVVGY